MISNFCRRNIHIVAPAIAVMASIVFLPNATNAANLKTYTFEYCIYDECSPVDIPRDRARGGYITVDYDNFSSSTSGNSNSGYFTSDSQISWNLDKWVDFGFYMDEQKIFSPQTSSYTLPAPTYTKNDLLSAFDFSETKLNFDFYSPGSNGYDGAMFGDYLVFLSFTAATVKQSNLEITEFIGRVAARRNPLGSITNSSITIENGSIGIKNSVSNEIRIYNFQPAPVRPRTPVPLPNFVIGIVAAGVGLGFKGLRHKAKLSKQAINI